MQDAQTCPSCGAKNLAAATWCSQCFTALGVAPPEPPPLPPAPETLRPDIPAPDIRAQDTKHEAPTTAPPATPSQQAGPHEAAESEATWTCRSCDTVNPVSVNNCVTCNTSIFDTFGAGADRAPRLDGQEAIRLALVPGLAHGRMGHGMHGVTIAVLFAAVAAMCVLLFVGGQAAMGVVMLLLALGILAASVHDALRLSEGRTDAMLLKPRTLTVIGGSAVMLVIIVIWNQGLSG